MEEQEVRTGNKSKQLVLTAIAVVTLLTAVVGATFAYFTFTSTISSGTNTITSTTGTVGNVTLTATTAAMHITTAAAQFAESAKGTTYYATSTAANYVGSAETNVINTLQAGTGADGNIYECTYSLAVVTTGLPSGLTAGDYVVTISGVSTINLDMATAANASKTYTVKRYLSGTTAKTISASAKLVNSEAVQNYLQDQTIVTTFTASGLSCTLVASAGTDTMTAA